MLFVALICAKFQWVITHAYLLQTKKTHTNIQINYNKPKQNKAKKTKKTKKTINTHKFITHCKVNTNFNLNLFLSKNKALTIQHIHTHTHTHTQKTNTHNKTIKHIPKKKSKKKNSQT